MGCLQLKPLSEEQMKATHGGGGRLRVVNYHDTDGDGLLDAKSVKIYKDGALVKSKWVYDRKY